MIHPDNEAAAQLGVGPALRLLVVSDTRFVREALARALEGEPSVAAAACSSPQDAAISIARADAVLVDVSHANGDATVRRLREVAPLRPIIAYAMPESDDEVVQWAEAGVTGYLPSTARLTQLPGMVSDILAGVQACSGRIAAALFRRIADLEHALPVSHPAATRCLTPRELQIAELVAAGFSDKQITRELHISLYTTKTHVHNLLGKLNVGGRAEVSDALRVAGFAAAARRPGARDASGKIAAD